MFDTKVGVTGRRLTSDNDGAISKPDGTMGVSG